MLLKEPNFTGRQAIAVPSVLADGNVVMAVKTGSGKTQAYLAPLFNKLLEVIENEIDTAGSQTLVVTSSSKRQNFALVLCPNAMLCEQVMQMANILCDNFKTSLLKVSVVSRGHNHRDIACVKETGQRLAEYVKFYDVPFLYQAIVSN
ncbi:hypothetical protein L7F22_046443 [Adiantum nelumboides]|nr:hypothetical protein [Adiantum nelumboides]MCO5592438.1 hypothetical protein [Adiantum nelumboides]MCO5592441.1 hypothetical protein [Adiantum nelumboides]